VPLAADPLGRVVVPFVPLVGERTECAFEFVPSPFVVEGNVQSYVPK
jgi:hypothetical protein